MGFLDLFKKKEIKVENNVDTFHIKIPKENLAPKITEDLEHLTKDGELPWGWHTHTKDFTDKINNEFSYFLNMWLDSRNKSAEEYYSALKSFILYLEDVEKLCKSKGECFEFWFTSKASKDYISQRKAELDDLTQNFESYQKKYEFKLQKEKKIIEIEDTVILLLKENDGILQSQFWCLFDDEVSKEAAKDIVYRLLKEGKIQRTKSGRSFILHNNL